MKLARYRNRLNALAPNLGRARSARAHIVALIVACIVPMVLFSAFAMVRFADQERVADRAQLVGTVRAMSAAIDLKLDTAAAALAALGTSPALADGDLARFYRQAQDAAGGRGAWIILASPKGEQILNTRKPFGAALRPLHAMKPIEAAIASGSAQVSDLIQVGEIGQPLVSVYVPVILDEKVAYVLLMNFLAEEIRDMLLAQHWPASWNGAVIGSDRRIIARMRQADGLAGKPAAPALAQRMASAGQGTFVATNHEGQPVVMAITRSALSGWALVLSIPLAEVNAPLDRSLFVIGVAAAAMLLIGIGFAVLVGGRIGRSMRQLSTATLRLGQGLPVKMTGCSVSEIDQVVAAHATAAALLDQRARERDAAEAALRRGEQRFRDIAEVSTDWIWETGPDHRFTSVAGNRGAPTADPGKVLGKTPWQLWSSESSDERWAAHRRIFEARTPFRGFRVAAVTPSKRTIQLLVSGTPFYDDAGNFAGYRGTASDVTTEVEALQRAEAAEALLRDAIESISEGFVVFDRQDRLVMWNEAYTRLYPRTAGDLRPGITFEDILRRSVAYGEHPAAAGREEAWITERLARHRNPAGPIEQRLNDGRHILITERRMANGGITGLRTDITPLKRAEAALRVAQKMDALGTLAGGIAHDLNNTLVPIIGLTVLTIDSLPAASPAREDLADVLSAARHAKDLVAQILTFSRSGASDTVFGPLDLGQVMDDALRLLRPAIPSTIKLQVEPPTGPLPIAGSATQIHQVLMNLCSNAVSAIGGRLGSISIAVKREPSVPASELPYGLHPGDYARITVSDDGCGMDEKTCQRIFEPFFTTKGVGEGTGLGLAIVHGVMQAHGGAVLVSSQPGHGSRFDLLFPLVSGPAAASTEAALTANF